MKLSYVLLAAVALTSAAPALASKSDNAKPAKEKKVCRREEVTGSMIGMNSVCHTKEEWDAIDKANADSTQTDMNRIRMQGGALRKP